MLYTNYLILLLISLRNWQYARHITWYLQEMSCLPEDAKSDLMAGAFVCGHQEGVWNWVSADQFGEKTYIRYGKSKGGLVGVSLLAEQGGGPRVVVSTAAFHARVRGSVPGLGGLKETKLFLPHPRVKVSIVGSLRDREVACSASDLQGSNFESCVWRTVSSQSSHHPQEVLLAQFSLYVHKGGLKPDSFHFLAEQVACWVLSYPLCQRVSQADVCIYWQ